MSIVTVKLPTKSHIYRRSWHVKANGRTTTFLTLVICGGEEGIIQCRPVYPITIGNANITRVTVNLDRIESFTAEDEKDYQIPEYFFQVE
jgi:hypothetical protein